MNKTDEKRSLFYRIYFGALIVFALLLIAGLIVAYFALSDFEASRPKNYAENIFETYFKKGDYIGLLEKCSYDINPFEDREKVKKIISETYNKEKLDYLSVYSDDPSIYNYQVTYDGEPLGTFSLKNNGKKNFFGFDECELAGADISAGYGTVRVKALFGSDVYINGKKLGDEYITEEDIKTSSCDFMPKGVNGITYDLYTADGFICKPEVKVTSDRGEHPVKYNDDEKLFESEIIFSKELEKEYAGYCLDAIKSYAKYMQGDGKRAEALQYIDRKSDLYFNVSATLVQFVNKHSGYSFENESAGEFYAYDENTFSCRIIMDHCLFRSKTDTYKDHIDMTVYLRKVGDKYLIYQWQ